MERSRELSSKADPARFSNLLIDTVKQHGIPLAGALDLTPLLEGSEKELFSPHIARYDDWLKQGYAGAMGYLQRGRDRRANPKLVFPEAESILCVAVPYPAQKPGAQNRSVGPQYARYLQGPDYHDVLAEKLEAIMQQVRASLDSAPERESLRWKVCVDTSALLERSWAALAGLGWIGKNTLLIHPQYGSYLFLAEVLINRPVGQGPRPLPNYCGSCQRCLTACPTQAFPKPGVLDSNQCISYLTLEKRGPLTPQESKKTADWVAGCDICQEVCPFNTKATKAAQAQPSPIDPALDATRLNEWQSLLEESENEYQARVRVSSLNRVKPVQFRRNLAAALLHSLAGLDPEERLLRFSSLIELLRQKAAEESDESVQAQWIECLRLLTPHSMGSKNRIP